MESPPEREPRNDNAARGCIVVHFTGSRASLDADTVLRVGGKLFALADEPGGADLLLDFGNVDFLSAMALGILVRLHEKLTAGRRHLTIANLSPQVYEIFAVARLDTYLDLRAICCLFHQSFQASTALACWAAVAVAAGPKSWPLSCRSA
jgi:anti-anti-sigma factor